MEGSNHLHTLHRSLPFLAMSRSLQLEKYVTQECLCAVKIVQNPNSKTEESLIEKKQHPTRCRIHAAYCVMLTADADYAKYILVALKMFQLLNQCICGTSLCGTQLCERFFNLIAICHPIQWSTLLISKTAIQFVLSSCLPFKVILSNPKGSPVKSDHAQS